MKPSVLPKAAELAVALQMKAVDRLIEEFIEPLADIGNPERLIGKKYEDWTPEDLQRLARIYGTAEPNSLSRFIFNKEYERVTKSLED